MPCIVAYIISKKKKKKRERESNSGTISFVEFILEMRSYPLNINFDVLLFVRKRANKLAKKFLRNLYE